jgi:hypothetical protein
MSPGKREGSAEEDAVANFREYLRIPSVQPDVKYGMLYRTMEVMVSVDLLLRTKCERILKGICTCTYYFREKEMTRSPSPVIRSNEC